MQNTQEYKQSEFEMLSLMIAYNDFIDRTILKKEYFEDARLKQVFEIICDEYCKAKTLILSKLAEYENFDYTLYAELLDGNLHNSDREIAFKELERKIIEDYKQRQYKQITLSFNGNCEETYQELTKINDINYNENEYINAKDIYETLSQRKEQIKLGYPYIDQALNLSQNDLMILAGGTGCVDCDTEYFNGYEWKKISEYKNGEKILQYEPNTKQAILLEPLKFHKLECENLNHIKTKYGIDMCLSNEHSVYYLNKNNNLKEISCEDMIKIHSKNKKGFTGKFITTFNYEGPGIALTNDEIKLMLAVICDGTFDKRRRTNRCTIKVKKERKIKELETILASIGKPFQKTSLKNGYINFYFDAPLKQKYFDKSWYSSNKEQLKIVCDNILMWDGNDKNRFSTTIKETADFVQFAFASCGYRATISVRNRTGRKKIIGKKEYYTKSIDYDIHITDRILPSLCSMKKCKINNYITKDGFKYCFTTTTGLWVMRRNNRIIVTGNCGKTAFALNLLNNLSKDYQCIYFNMEMSKNILYKRLIGITTGITLPELNNFNDLTNENKIKSKNAMLELQNRKIILVNKSLTINQIKKYISTIKTDKHTIIFLDHIGLIKSKGNSLYERMTEIAKELRSISIDNNCTIIGLCQLSREAQKNDTIPKLQDLRDSGEIEQSARKVIMIHNKSKNKTDRVQDMEIIIAKNDDGNKIIKEFEFDRYTQIFTEPYK